MNPPHLKQVRSYNNPGEAHELTFSCYRRLPLLDRGRTRRWFVDAMESSTDPFKTASVGLRHHA